MQLRSQPMGTRARSHYSTRRAAVAGAPRALEVFVQILGRWIVFVVCVAAVISLIVRIIVNASLDSRVMDDLDLLTGVGRFDGFVWFAAYGAAVGFMSGLLVGGIAAAVLVRWPSRRRATRFAQCASAVFVGGLLTLSVSSGSGLGFTESGAMRSPQRIDLLYIVTAAVAAAVVSPALLVGWYTRRLRGP